MYDAVCAVCQSMIEIPAQAVEAKGFHRCVKCWTWLRVLDSHPLRLEGVAGDMVATGSSVRARHNTTDTEEDDE